MRGAMAALLFLPALAWGQVPAEVHGRVTSRSDGRTIAGAIVEDVAAGGGASTNDQGDFVLRGLPPGRRTLRVRAVGYRPVSLGVGVENGLTTTMDVTLEPVTARLAPIAVVAAADTANAGATTITRVEIERSGRRDLGSLLSGQAGVLVTPYGGPGAPATLSMRGSDANEILVLVDGVPINSPLTGIADLSTIPLNTVQRITVVRGAQSARWGGRAMAGVVLIETRRPTGAEAELDVTAASWGERDGTLSVGGTGPADIGGVMTASRRLTRNDYPYDVPDIRGGGTAVLGNGGFSSTGIDGALSRDIAPIALRVHGTYLSDARGVPGSIAAPSLEARNTDEHVAGGVDARADHGIVRWTADLEAEHQRTTFVDTNPPIGAPYNDRIGASSLSALASVGTGGPRLSASAGVEARWIDISATALSANAPASEHEDGIWTRVEASQPVGRAVTLGAEAGARVDWSSLLDGPQFSPRVGVSASHGPLTLHVSVGNGFAPPALADQYFHEGVQVQPNPNLKPEEVRGEVEGRLTLHEIAVGPLLRVSGDVAAYRADVDGMILWFPDFRFVWSPNNFDVHCSGWDGSLALTLPPAGFTLRGTITQVVVDYATAPLSGQVAYRPRTTGSLTGSLTRGPATLDVTTRYIGDRRTVEGSALNSIGAYWLTDAQLTLHVPGTPWPLDVLAGVDNAFDRHVALLFDYPLPPRTWVLGIKIRTPSHSYLP